MLSRGVNFAYFHSPIVGRLWLFVALMALYSGAVWFVEVHYLGKYLDIHPQLHALLGAVLGMLLVFRTNTAYDRWWEGRKLWGQLVNDSRNLAIKVRAVSTIADADAKHLGRLLVNFARALKEHLREGVRAKQLSLYGNIPLEPRHIPAHVAGMIRDRIRLWKTESKIDGADDMILDVHARALMDICGACERIRRTPIAKSYLGFIRQSIVVYLLTLPWGLVHDFKFWMVPAAVIIAYFMIGIELIAEEVEEPFGRGEDDLVLDDICQTIEASVLEILTRPRQDAQTPVSQIADVGKS